MSLYDTVADGIIKEGEYKAELALKENQQNIEESYGKRGFSRKPGLMTRDLRLNHESYGDAIRETHAMALDKVEQLKLADYEAQERINWLSLSDNIDTEEIIENLMVDKEEAVSLIDLGYTRTAKEIDMHGDSAAILERTHQKVLTDIDVSNIELDSNKNVQQIDLDSEVAASTVKFGYAKEAKGIELQGKQH